VQRPLLPLPPGHGGHGSHYTTAVAALVRRFRKHTCIMSAFIKNSLFNYTTSPFNILGNNFFKNNIFRLSTAVATSFKATRE